MVADCVLFFYRRVWMFRGCRLRVVIIAVFDYMIGVVVNEFASSVVPLLCWQQWFDACSRCVVVCLIICMRVAALPRVEVLLWCVGFFVSSTYK